MRRTLTLAAAMVLLAVTAVNWAADTGPAKIRVLLITGDDVVPAHNWPVTSQTTREILDKSGRFEVRVCEDPGILDSAQSLKAYDAILFAMYNKKLPTISHAAKDNLLNFVKSGKGVVVQHLASASFADWPEFGQLCGPGLVRVVGTHYLDTGGQPVDSVAGQVSPGDKYSLCGHDRSILWFNVGVLDLPCV